MPKATAKYHDELRFWRNRFTQEGGKFQNSHYARLMLALTGNDNDEFLKGKVVADFGSGPRGSLAWTKAPARRLGIDVLAPEYLKFFGEDLATHGMDYLPSTEDEIPLPDACVDVLFTINSLDHVSNLEAMSGELLRILKPGGLFAGSFNLFEPVSECEPQTLDELKIRELFFKKIKITSYRVALRHPKSTYKNMFENRLVKNCDPVTPHVLWLTGNKKT